MTRPFVFPVGSWSSVHLDTDTGLAAEEDAAAAYSELIVFLRRRRPKSGNTLLTICMDVGQTNKQLAMGRGVLPSRCCISVHPLHPG